MKKVRAHEYSKILAAALAVILIFSVPLNGLVFAEEVLQTFSDDFGSDEAGGQADYNKIYKLLPGASGKLLNITNEKPEEYLDERGKQDVFKMQQAEAGAGASLVYRIEKEIDSFAIQEFRRMDQKAAVLKFYTSSDFNSSTDTATWSEIEVTNVQTGADTTNFMCFERRSNMPVPKGHNYLKIEFFDAPMAWGWNPRLGKVDIFYKEEQPRISERNPKDAEKYVKPVNSVELTLDSNVESTTVIPANFSINNGIKITQATYQSQSKKITLTFDKTLLYDTQYTVTVNEKVKNPQGISLPPGDRVFWFETDMSLKAGAITYKNNGIVVADINNLKAGDNVEISSEVFNGLNVAQSGVMVAALYQGNTLYDISCGAVEIDGGSTKPVSANLSIPPDGPSGYTLKAFVYSKLFDVKSISEKAETPVAFQGKPTANAQCTVENETGKVSINGSISSGMQGQKLSVIVLNANISAGRLTQLQGLSASEQLQSINSADIDHFAVVTTGVDGKYSLQYTIRDKDVVGMYHVLVGSYDADKSASASFDYFSPNAEQALLQKIKGTSAENLGNVLLEENKYLNLDLGGLYSQLNQTAVHRLILLGTFHSIEAFVTVFYDSVFTELMNSHQTESDILASLIHYSADYQLPQADVNYSSVIQNKALVLAGLKGKEFLNLSEIRTAFSNAVAAQMKAELVAGDINNDGEINMLDAVKLYNASSQEELSVNERIRSLKNGNIELSSALNHFDELLLNQIKPLLAGDIDSNWLINKKDVETLFENTRNSTVDAGTPTAASPYISIDDASGKAGEEVTVSVHFSNPCRISGLKMLIEYDSGILELTSASMLPDFSGWLGSVKQPALGTVAVDYIAQTDSEVNKICALKFKVLNGANAGVYNITVDSATAIDTADSPKYVPLKSYHGNFTVFKKENNSDGGTGTGGRSSSGGGTYVVPLDQTNVDTPTTETPKLVFSDLETVPWAQSQIAYLEKQGVINGTDDGFFQPERDITRAEFVKLICLAFKLNHHPSTKEFADVKGMWHEGYVGAMADLNVVGGYPDGNFYPDQTISREEAVSIIYRTLIALYPNQTFDASSSNYSDRYEMADWALEAIDFASEKGIVNGVDSSIFMPKGNASRAQAAVIIYRVLEYLEMISF